MTQGTISLGPSTQPALYTGRVVGLHGSRILGSLSSGDGSSLAVTVDVSVNQESGSVSGTVHARQESGG